MLYKNFQFLFFPYTAFIKARAEWLPLQQLGELEYIDLVVMTILTDELLLLPPL